MLAIELENAHKAYDGLPVLRGVNLQVAQGEIYGLLGPNGAGKSTIMHLLLGFLRPQQGRVRVLGSTDLSRNRARVGYLPERLRYHLRFSAREYLRYLGSFNDLEGAALNQRVDAELAAVGLSEVANRQLATYSRGMLQRVGIAQALLNQPDVLLIDEPTGGLDLGGQREMLELLAALRQRGCATLLTTHYLDEIEQVCDRVGILFDGRIAAETDIEALYVPSPNVAITVGELPYSLADQLSAISPAVLVQGQQVTINPNTQTLQARVLRTLLDANVAVLALQPQIKPLADLFERVTRGEVPPNAPAAPPPDALFAPPSAQHKPSDPLLTELLQREDDHQ